METTWQFQTSTKEAWDSMLADCRAAEYSIDIEQYIFLDDEVGRIFFDALIQKARQNVAVRLLCDMVGSADFYFSKRVQELKDAGVHVEFFNPVSPWRLNSFTTWFFRDHRKVLVFDNRVGYVGGVGFNIDMKEWRDTQVRLTGPVVKQLQGNFEWMWHVAHKRQFIPYRVPHAFDDGFSILPSSPRRHQRFIVRKLIDAIRSAEQYLYLTTPYFVPNHRFLRMVRLAARRGVDVRLLVPGENDVPIVDYAGKHYFDALLRAGVRVYLYNPNVLHAKTVAIDDTWGTIGSCNLDNLSFRFNYEANVVSTHQSFVQDLKSQFLEDLRHSNEIDLARWRARSWFARVKEWLVWPIHAFL